MRNLVNLLFFAAVAASTLVLPVRAETITDRDAGVRLVALSTFAQTSCPRYKLDRNVLNDVYHKINFDPGSMSEPEVDTATRHLYMMKNARGEWCDAAWEAFGEHGNGYPGVLVRY